MRRGASSVREVVWYRHADMMRWLLDLFGAGRTAVAGTAGRDADAPRPAEVAAEPAPAPPAAPAGSGASGVSWLTRAEVDATFTGWLFAKSDYADLQTTRVEQAILDTLDRIVASPQSGAQLVRRMPGVIPQLLQSLRTNDFSGAELARKISHDVVLVAEVIRLANSSLYAKEDRIASVEHAVLVLGQDGLRHLITSVAFRPIIDLKSGNFSRLVAPRIWLHSERCAMAARLLAHQEGVNGFDAFLSGLMQNVGLIVSLRVMDEGTDGNAALGSTAFCNALIPRARMLSASIAREWHFPESVSTAIEEQAIVQRRTTLSDTGRHLSLADYLGKLNLLVGNGRLAPDASLTQGLSSSATDCYAELQALTVSGTA